MMNFIAILMDVFRGIGRCACCCVLCNPLSLSADVSTRVDSSSETCPFLFRSRCSMRFTLITSLIVSTELVAIAGVALFFESSMILWVGLVFVWLTISLLIAICLNTTVFRDKHKTLLFQVIVSLASLCIGFLIWLFCILVSLAILAASLSGWDS